MDLELAAKVALVTGASRGIGRAIAEGLAAEGARLVIAARGSEALDFRHQSIVLKRLIRLTQLLLVQRRRVAISTLIASIVLRGMIAPGYMPSALADGYPVTLCPQGLDRGWYELISVPAAAEAYHLHNHHHTHDQIGDDHDDSALDLEADHPLERCALGNALKMTALLTAAHSFEATSHTSVNAAADIEFLAPIRASPFRARAPPRLFPL